MLHPLCLECAPFSPFNFSFFFFLANSDLAKQGSPSRISSFMKLFLSNPEIIGLTKHFMDLLVTAQSLDTFPHHITLIIFSP